MKMLAIAASISTLLFAGQAGAEAYSAIKADAPGVIIARLEGHKHIDRARNGETALHRAAKYGHVNECRQLIARGANVNARDEDLETPLHHAADKGHAEIVWLLLARGADANARDEDRDTPLHKAAEEGHVEICKLLLAGGARMNARNEDGEPPLVKALDDEQWETAKFLLARGADASVKKHGLDLIHWLEHKRKAERARRAGVYEPLRKAMHRR